VAGGYDYSASRLWFFTAYCSAVVVPMPALCTLHPVAVSPAVTAFVSMGPLVLASCPMRRFCFFEECADGCACFCCHSV